jgi:hypothetical protein
MSGAPLVLASTSSDGWVLLSSAAQTIATYCAEVHDVAGKCVVGVLVRAS